MHQPLGSYPCLLLSEYEVLDVCFHRVHTSSDKSASRSWTRHAAPGIRLKGLLANGSRRQRQC